MFFDVFDFFKAVDSAAVDAGALISRKVPGPRASQITGPERPHSALAWPNRINHTAFLTVCFFEEYTIFGSQLLNYCGAQSRALEVFFG